MKVLIACEESQRVCTEFRKRGHKAFSCDIQPPSGGHPEWHICGDVLQILTPILGGIDFETMDGEKHSFCGMWDLVIAHPPCTYLSFAGNRYLNVKRYGQKAIERHEKRQAALEFFMKFVSAAVDTGAAMCIENPLGFVSTAYRPADQIIHPYQFAASADDAENYVKKRTCLWLFGLPKLQANNLPAPSETLFCERQPHRSGDGLNCDEYRRKLRSKTFPGIARAMAEQWG